MRIPTVSIASRSFINYIVWYGIPSQFLLVRSILGYAERNALETMEDFVPGATADTYLCRICFVMDTIPQSRGQMQSLHLLPPTAAQSRPSRGILLTTPRLLLIMSMAGITWNIALTTFDRLWLALLTPRSKSGTIPSVGFEGGALPTSAVILKA